MSITKNGVPVQAAVSVAAGLTRTNAFVSTSLDVSAYRRGTVSWELANGASAPATAPQIVLQHSPDGAVWRDFYLSGGNTTSSGATAYTDQTGMPTGSCDIPPGVKNVRGLCYGHTTNAIRLTIEFSGEVG